MSSRRTFWFIGVALVVLTATGVGMAQRGSAPTELPGPMGGGTTLLPNGWRIAPAGKHMMIGDLPLNMVLSPDGHHLIVTNNGYDKPTLRVVNLDHITVTSVVTLEDAWLGLAWSPDGTRLYSSGAASNSVLELGWQNGQLTKRRTFALGPQGSGQGANGSRPASAQQTFIGGISVSPDGAELAAVHVFGQKLSLVDLVSGKEKTTISLAAEPYTCVFSQDGKTLLVSLWGGAKILLFDAQTLAAKGEIVVGEHPNAMVQSKDGARLFVACANTNALWVVDLASMKTTEQVSIALFPNAPMGSTPNALGLSPDGQRLLVTNADNNSVAVVDVSKPGDDRVAGFIPTGWYPTGAIFGHDGRAIYVLSGKGLTSMANPRGAQPGIAGAPGQYSGSLLQGSLSLLPTPDDATLAKYTKTVLSVTPYTDATRLAPASAPAQSPIPRRVGDPSLIKHVFYIIRENRTYDQILGDLDRGNGDPTLALFGDEITPNAHALAKQFVTLDNFYVDAEVSYSGHAFSTGAISDDFVEKIWPTNYANRGGAYLSEGTGQMRNAYGNITAPQNGYLWDYCLRAKGCSVRSYGEFVEADRATGGFKASVPGLAGHVAPDYPGFDLKVPDQHRVDVWLKEFQAFEADGQLPTLTIIRLPNDHTNGTRADVLTPRALVADNDLGLGRIVEAISKSRYWNDSAIFVLEDDAQNGPDHVDCHRSPAFVASPYARHDAVDSTLYTTSGMLRTMELILGLPPMSQYDAAATPMYHAFTMTPAPAPFTHVPEHISLTELNGANAPGAALSAAMNFDVADMINEDELNQILWQSIHGPLSFVPPPVHAAFVRKPSGQTGDGDGDDDDIIR